MRKAFVFIVFVAFLPTTLLSQTHNLTGIVVGEKAGSLIAATAVLMNPTDSTLEFFGITDNEGFFEIRSVRPGDYLMQIAYLGYESRYKPITVPYGNNNALGTIELKPKPVDLKEVQVTADYVPIQIKNDTVEFNARAFKTIPDANVEALLKKLPGIEVDRDGNIKGFGKDISKVLVDGKEFFGNDAKMATRNIPADAIDKIQMYDKRSDESEFTGIDDGTRDKTLNLMLKEDRRKGIFGDVEAGGGTDYHYTASAKLYRFVGKTQMALLGMTNDVNKLGFTSGLGTMTTGGQVIRYGEPSGSSGKGTASSGAGGANFSYTWGKDRRVFASYMLNGVNRRITESIKTQNFMPDRSYNQDERVHQILRDTSHRITFGLRNRIDSSQTLLMNGVANFSSNFSPQNSLTNSFQDDFQINKLNTISTANSTQVFANVIGSYLKKFRNKSTVFKIGAKGSFQSMLSESSFVNDTEYFVPANLVTVSRFQDVNSRTYSYDANISLSQRISSGLAFLEPEVVLGETNSRYSKKMGLPGEERMVIDSISPDFEKSYRWMRPEIGLKWNFRKTQFTAALSAELGQLGTSLWGVLSEKQSYIYLTPSLFWQREFRSGRMLNLNYSSSVNTPSISQLLPVADYTNPLSISVGNRNLKPEYSHNLYLFWILVDAFSSTSVNTNVNASYVLNKINWSRVIDDQLRQKLTLVNVKDHYNVLGNIDFSTAIRKIGTKIRTKLAENFNRGITIVNGVENINTSLAHNFSVTLENRNKKKLDVSVGASATFTNAWYSIQESLNNQYLDLSYFSDIYFYPNNKWSFSVSADVTNYTAKSFDAPVSIPLLGAEISYSFLKNNRGLLKLVVSDLLNKNTGISRVSEMNYLMERQSNMIGRYVMLSFKYKINKFGK